MWWATNDPKLSRKVRRLVQGEQVSIFVSAASAWEIATKRRLGKLKWTTEQSVEAYCVGQGFELLPITFAHASKAGSWPQDHGDPFDRMLAAQSELETMPLATNDEKIERFPISTIW